MSKTGSKRVTELLHRSRGAQGELDAALADIRKQIADLKRERRGVEQLPAPLEAALRNASRYCDGIIDATIAEHADYHLLRFMVPEAAFSPSPLASSQSLITQWLMRKIREGVADAVRAAYDRLDAEPVSDIERAKRLDQIDSDLLAAELAEESLIRTAEGAGFLVARRTDADPRAVLAHQAALP